MGQCNEQNKPGGIDRIKTTEKMDDEWILIGCVKVPVKQ